MGTKQSEANRFIDKDYLARLNKKIDKIIASIPETVRFKLSFTEAQLRWVFAYIISGRQIVAEMVYKGVEDPRQLTVQERKTLQQMAHRRWKGKKYQKAIKEFQKFIDPDPLQLAESKIVDLLQSPDLSPKDAVQLINAVIKIKELQRGKGKKDKRGDILEELLKGE